MKTPVKDFWRSRTIWVNILSLVALVVQQQYGFVVDVELQGAILLVLNVILRFDTSESIH